MSKMMGLSPLVRAAEQAKRKPDMKSGKMQNVIRYISGSDPNKRPKLGTSKPGTPKS